MIVLSKERVGEIAFAYLKIEVKAKDLPAPDSVNNLHREIGNLIKKSDFMDAGITLEEAMAFHSLLYKDAALELIANIEKGVR